ncbi:MAG: adenylate kinase, partial [Candidatus Heimdallarchaeota archaeon]|nr:adenylate kinase [Candidatus Heimdallarchaeota archaeon]
IDLTHRSDDNEETFQKRWDTYISQSAAVIDYYGQKDGLIQKIDGTKTMSYTEDELRKILKL